MPKLQPLSILAKVKITATLRKHFCRLVRQNKEGIPFVQGRYNMGSTGSICFCTRAELMSGHYKFILSKRNLDELPTAYGDGLLSGLEHLAKARVCLLRSTFAQTAKSPVFAADEIQAFGVKKLGVMHKGGSVVKLYEYDIGFWRGTESILACVML